MKLFQSTFVLATLLALVLCVHAQIKCSGKPNMNPVWDKEPTLVRTVKNGKLYHVGGEEPRINLLHTWGTPYEMGFAHGSLLKEETQQMYDEVFDWIAEAIDDYIKFLPEDFRKALEKFGIAGALDLTYVLTHKYIPEHFIEEFHGIADGSGIPFSRVVQLHMFPELIKAHCSMFGAWGPAISQTNGTLYQLRALDWSTDGPFQKFPLVQISHPNKGNGHAFANVAWTGFVGTLTGLSSAPVGVCEKVWLSYSGKSSRSGYPWHFLLRDVLQYDADIDSALSRIATARRTCSIFVGLGDAHINQFRAVEYSHENVTVMDDLNYPAYPPAHPLMKGVVFVDKHVQPSQHPCLGSLMEKYYGKISPENTMRYIAPLHETGDMHLSVYDYKNLVIYVSNASPYDKSTGHAVPAYDRQFVKFDLKRLFAETQ